MSGVRKRSKTSAQYWCNLRNGGGPAACRGQSVAESVARAATVRFLQELLTERIALEQFIEGAARRFDGTDEALAREAEAELQSLEQQKRNLIDAVAGGLLRPDDIKAKNLELGEQRERLERRMAAASCRQELRTEVAAAVQLLEGEGLAARVASLPDLALQRLLRLVVKRLTFTGTGRGHNRIGAVETYEFTPEFADFLGHCGSHIADFAALISLKRLGLGFAKG